MTREEVQQDLIKMVGDHLNVPQESIDDESTMKGLGADSLDMVEIIMHIEEKFNINIDDADVEKVETFEQLTDIVTKKIGEGTK
jgi:acyl carrier protein